MHPPIETQAEFRAAGNLVKLEGGRGNAWRVGDVTLKPPEELLWLDEIARKLSVGGELRLSIPIRSRSGKLIVGPPITAPYIADLVSARRQVFDPLP